MKACEIECLGQNYTVLSLTMARSEDKIAEIVSEERSIPIKLTFDAAADFSAELPTKKGSLAEAAAAVAYYYLVCASYPLKSVEVRLNGEMHIAKLFESIPAKIAVKLPKCKQMVAKSVVLPNSVQLNCYEVICTERYAVYACRDIRDADFFAIGTSLCRALHTHAAVIFSHGTDGKISVAVYTERGYGHLCNSEALSAAYRVGRSLGGGGECAVKFSDIDAEIKIHSGVPWLIFAPRLITVKDI